MGKGGKGTQQAGLGQMSLRKVHMEVESLESHVFVPK